MPIDSVLGSSIAGSNPGSQMSQNSSPAASEAGFSGIGSSDGGSDAGGFGRMSGSGAGSFGCMRGANASQAHKCKKIYSPSIFKVIGTDPKRDMLAKPNGDGMGKKTVYRKKSELGDSNYDVKDCDLQKKAKEEPKSLDRILINAAAHILKNS